MGETLATAVIGAWVIAAVVLILGNRIDRLEKKIDVLTAIAPVREEEDE